MCFQLNRRCRLDTGRELELAPEPVRTKQEKHKLLIALQVSSGRPANFRGARVASGYP